MARLYLLFCRLIVRQSVILCLASVGVLLALQQFFLHQSPTGSLLALGLAWIGIAAFQAHRCIPQNLNWLVMMPLSKRNLIALTFLVNVTVLLFAAGCFALALAGTDLVKNGEFRNTDIVLGWIESFLRYAYWRLFTSPAAFAWATAFLLGSYSVMLLTIPSWRVPKSFSLHLFYRRFWNSPDPAQRNYVRSTALVLLVFCVVTRQFLMTPFGIFSSLLFVMAVTCPRMWRMAANISHVQQTFATVVFVTLALIESGWVYGLQRKALLSAFSDERVKAIEFLGPFAGPMSQPLLAEILEADLSRDSVSSIGNDYLRRFHEGRKVVTNQDQFLHFNVAVGTKQGLSALAKTVELFDASSLNLSDLKALFATMVPLTRDPRETRLFLMLLGAKLTETEFMQMFNSENEAEIRYALIRSRYLRDSSVLNQIRKNLPRYSDETVFIALTTLSLLKGERVTLEDWRSSQKGRQIASSFFDPNCEEFHPSSFDQPSPSEIPLINVCLRQRVDKQDLFLLEDIEDAGWIAPPINSFQKSLLGEVFP